MFKKLSIILAGFLCFFGAPLAFAAITSPNLIHLSGTTIVPNNSAWSFGGSISGLVPISSGGTATTTQVINGVNFFDGTRITSGTALTFDGTKLFAKQASTTNFEMVQYADNFSGSDIFAQANAAYAALPAAGGIIVLPAGQYSAATSLAINTANKPALVECAPGNATTITYTGTGTSTMWDVVGSSTATTQHKYDWGMRDCSLVGPGSSGTTAGIETGQSGRATGSLGGEGITFSGVKVIGFGIGFAISSNTWDAKMENGDLSGNGQNFVYEGSGAQNAGEGISFDHVVFADSNNTNNAHGLLGHYDSCIDLQQDLESINFTDSIYDDCNFYVGDGNLMVNISGGDFENPGKAGGTSPYIYVATGTKSTVSLKNIVMAMDTQSTDPANIPAYFIWDANNVTANTVRLATFGSSRGTVGNFIRGASGSSFELTNINSGKDASNASAVTTWYNNIGTPSIASYPILDHLISKLGGWGIGTLVTSGNLLQFTNGGVIQGTMDANGNWAFGTTSPDAQITIVQAVANLPTTVSANGALSIGDGATREMQFRVTPDLNFAIDADYNGVWATSTVIMRQGGLLDAVNNLAVSTTTSTAKFSILQTGTATQGNGALEIGDGAGRAIQLRLDQSQNIDFDTFFGGAWATSTTITRQTGLMTHVAGFVSQASSTIVGAGTITGATLLNSTLGVTGATTLSSTLGVTGLSTLTGGFVSQASSTIVGAGTISGAASICGALTVTGLLTASGNSTVAGSFMVATTTNGGAKLSVLQSGTATQGNGGIDLGDGAGRNFQLRLDANQNLDFDSFFGGAWIGTPTMTILRSGGAVGFSTTTPVWAVTASNANKPQLALTDSNSANNAWTFRNISNTLYIATSTYSATSSTAALNINPSGSLTVANLISCAGIQTSATGLMSCTSDARLKDILHPFTTGLDAVVKINPQAFMYKKGTDEYDGVVYNRFIAQDVQKAIPEAVNTGYGGWLQVDTTTILASVVNAIKDLAHNDSIQNQKIDLLIRTVRAQQAEIDNLQKNKAPAMCSVY